MNLNSEPLYNYRVLITMIDGTTMVSTCLAHSKWHAIDKIYTKLCSEQEDRSKYSASRVFSGQIGVDLSLL